MQVVSLLGRSLPALPLAASLAPFIPTLAIEEAASDSDDSKNGEMPASDTQSISSQPERAEARLCREVAGRGTKKCSIKMDGSERGASRNWMAEHA